MSFVRIKTDNYLAILVSQNRMLEVEAVCETEALSKARWFFETNLGLKDDEIVVAKIPSCIGVLG